ncbi:MAG: hypothetical protein QGG14_00845 [Planctomycetota bacterium]|jgi:hypothetical protein|nr:hypothetical protein [Planctomycetota bacterium]
MINWAGGKLPADTDAGVWFVSLHTADPGDDGQTANEATGTGYARVATTAATWGVATDATPSIMSSILAVTFPTAGGNWSAGTPFSHFGLWNTLAGTPEADYVGRGELSTPAPVYSGQTPIYPAGALRMSGTETP